MEDNILGMIDEESELSVTIQKLLHGPKDASQQGFFDSSGRVDMDDIRRLMKACVQEAQNADAQLPDTKAATPFHS